MESAILIAMNGNDNENDKNCSSSELIPTTTAVSQDNSAAIVISPLEDEDAFPAEPPGAPPLPVNQDGTPMYQYRDFGHIDEDHEEGGTNNNGDSSSAPGTGVVNRGGSESSIRVQKFPVKLYAILAQKEFHDIICWLPHGRSWKVLKPSMFESLVMPLFFEYSNYHSFNRLVNAWSFRRISTGPDRGSYYHEVSFLLPVLFVTNVGFHWVPSFSFHVFFVSSTAVSSRKAPFAKLHATIAENSQETPHEEKERTRLLPIGPDESIARHSRSSHPRSCRYRPSHACRSFFALRRIPPHYDRHAFARQQWWWWWCIHDDSSPTASASAAARR